MVQMAQTLKGRVHAVNITDGVAVLRMCPIVASAILLEHEMSRFVR